MLVALAATAKEKASNLSNGPEVYVSRRTPDVDLLSQWRSKLEEMIADLDGVDPRHRESETVVIEGDSRRCDQILPGGQQRFSLTVTSPPYPAEHDYTRNFRLELAIGGFVNDLSGLRSIKRRMLRSDSKGLYKGDDDGKLIRGFAPIARVIDEIQQEAAGRTHGFARQYPRVVAEYFGGLVAHLGSLYQVMVPGARCVLILGDQQSFLNVPIATAELLASFIKSAEIGFQVRDMVVVNQRWSTTRKRHLAENALILRRV
jgi:hypothetical protein